MLKRTRVGRYLSHYFPIPSDIRGAFYWLGQGSQLTKTLYGPVTLFLGPAVLLVIWTALLIEPPHFVAVILFLLPRRPVFRMKPSFSQDLIRAESADSEKQETSFSDESKADLEVSGHSQPDVKFS
ncbi:hypothetical protein PoB_002153100 [Plakobranchus ocellatus]|uniref:Bicarbonate transporter-like transmembrane domain-containing protein n=1 Tax=Plakobranchus ocellatus TaxID=259542 RepID=A0AAV3ZGJ0_9GAST|nr:hypothetical protein PoB_002153100 [Plakobranchus ocellatus]